MSYRKGFLDGITAYAWWKDGRQEVGTTGRTLATAIEKVEGTWNYDPPRRVTIDITCCARCGEDHPMSAAPLGAPLSGYTHVGLCRKTAKPVLVKFIKGES